MIPTIRIGGERKRRADRRPSRLATIALFVLLSVAWLAAVHMAWTRWQQINHQAQLEARV